MNLFLGTDRTTQKKVYIPKSSLDTHWHLIGGTGKGKTTAIHTLLHQLLIDPCAQDCWVIIDRMGNLSSELLLWMASDFCTDDVRRAPCFRRSLAAIFLLQPPRRKHAKTTNCLTIADAHLRSPRDPSQ